MNFKSQMVMDKILLSHDDRGVDAGLVNDIVPDKLAIVSLKIVCNDDGPVVHKMGGFVLRFRFQ